MRYPTKLNKDNVLNIISDYQIFRRYLGHEFELKHCYPAPYRVDNDPSLSIFVHGRLKCLYFKDLGDGRHGDCFQLVQDIYKVDFYDALRIVADDFGLDFNTGIAIKLKEEDTNYEYSKEETFKNIEIVPQRYTITDKDYWEARGGSLEQCRKFKIWSAQTVYVDDFIRCNYSDESPVYAYRINGKWKVYRPLEPNKQRKWISNITTNDIQGYAQLPKTGEICIIQKSLKDIVCLDTFSFPAISPLSENTSLPKGAIKDLKKRFKHILIYFDNDSRGIAAAKRMHEETGFMYIHNPIGTPKDPSDYYLDYGHQETELLLNELIYGSI